MVYTAQLGPADPTVNFKFTVTFDGVDAVGFSKISGLRASITPFTWTECTELISPRKLPDVINFGPVIFERGLTTSSFLCAKMYQMYQMSRGGTAGLGAYKGFKKVFIRLPDYRQGAEALGAAVTAVTNFLGGPSLPGRDFNAVNSPGGGAVSHGFILHYAWPIGLEAEPLDAQSSKVLIHKLTVSCEGMDFF